MNGRRLPGRLLKSLGLAALIVLASSPVPAKTSPIALDSARSQASFSVQLLLMPSAEGRFGSVSGELQPVDKQQWRVRVRVDARAIDFDGPDWLARATRSEKFLDVDKHPEIVFESEPFPVALLSQGGALIGKLGLRGQTRQVAFTLAPSACKRPGHACAIAVSGAIHRREYGMRAYRLALRDRVGFDFQVFLTAAIPPDMDVQVPRAHDSMDGGGRAASGTAAEATAGTPEEEQRTERLPDAQERP